MANISGMVVVEFINKSLQCGQLGSKKVRSSFLHASHNGGSTAVCTMALSRWGAEKSRVLNDPAVIVQAVIRHLMCNATLLIKIHLQVLNFSTTASLVNAEFRSDYQINILIMCAQ